MTPVYIHPYIEVDGVRSLPDSFIRWLFEEAERMGRAEWMFSDGSVNAPDEFLDAMKHRNQLWVLSCERMLRDASAVIGFAWLNGFRGRSAMAHFCVLCKDRSLAVRAGRIMLWHWLNAESDGECVLDVILGVAPQANRAAVRFAEDMGMVRAGVVPHRCYLDRTGKTCPGVYAYATRKEVERHG